MIDDKLLDEIVAAVERLCARRGLPPSVAMVAEEAGVESPGTTYNYLRIAVERGRVAQRNRKFMSNDMAQAWPAQEGR